MPFPEVADRLNAAFAGRYRVERELGCGGMGTVYLAEDQKHHRPVAIKVLNPQLAAVLGPERFLREIESEARLTHPHILPLHDSGEADGLLYYVMPYVEGESLRQRLERERQLPIAEALRIAREVADALDYAHRHGLVHRDIKPENILLEEHHAVVADFGIARAIAAAGPEKLTPSGMTLGTPAYMSPEQTTGSGSVDGRSDVYSLGCVLYEMLAGVPPFTGSTSQNLAHQHLNVAPRPVSALRTAVPERVDRALEKALAKPAADRFATAAEFAAAIDSGLSAPDRAGEATPRKGAAPRRVAPRVRWLAIAAVATLIAIGAFAAARNLDALSRWFGGSSTTTPGSKDWILVADFDGPTNDPSLARAARDLVSSVLDQSIVVATVPRDQIKLGLERAGKPDTLPLTPELAREIAYRGSVRAVLEGEIAGLGSQYTVTLRVTDVEENKQLATLTDVARSKDGLIPVLRRMGIRICERLGETPGMIRTTRENKWPAATPSFEAYRRFAEAGELFEQGDFAGTLELNRQAVAIDPEFGAGWGAVAAAYMQLGQLDSALTALHEAMKHPRSITPAYRLYLEGVSAWWRGDARGAVETFERVTRAYPRAYETGFARNNWSLILMSEGRISDAYQVAGYEERSEPFGTSQIGQQVRARFLIMMGRLSEARSAIQGLRGYRRQQADLDLALAEAGWSEADSQLHVYEQTPGGSWDITAAGARAQVAAARGEVSAAEVHLLRAEQMLGEKSTAARMPRAQVPRARVLLALMSGRQVPRPEPWLASDTTTAALITRGYMAAAAGETTLARELLTRLRSRTTTRLGAHGSTPEFIEASIVAHARRWNDVIRLIAEPAREGSDHGRTSPDPVSQRIGTPAERWLVAQAYERLGQPDSAAAFYQRMLAPGYSVWSLGGLVHTIVHQRLVLLYAGMGRLEEAERHLGTLERDVTRPDPDVRRLLDDARNAVRSARGMARRDTGRS